MIKWIEKKIIIFGFGHSGTTVLQKIISNVEEVFNIKCETNRITNDKIKKT